MNPRALALLAATACTSPMQATETQAAPPRSCADFQHLLPDDMSCEIGSASTASDYETAKAGGLALRMEVSRDGERFREVPLSTQICTGDFLAYRFETRGSGELQIVNHGTSGGWKRIHPSDGKSGAFPGGSRIRVPAVLNEGFEVKNPPGTEYLMFFLSPGRLSSEMHGQIDRITGQETESTKGERSIFIPEIGETDSLYLVVEKEQSLAIAVNHSKDCKPLP